ncbi:RNA polymerase sigma factor [compost metagenome]
MWSSNRHIRIEEQEYYTLLHKFHPLIIALIYKKIKNRDDVLDVYQNVIIHIWQYRSKLDSKNIEGIIVKTCLQEIAHFYRNTKRTQTDALPLDHSDTTMEDVLIAERKEQNLLEIEKAIEELLPPLRRKIFKMNKLDGITQEKIATTLNISKRSVEQHISKSIIFLKNKVKIY